MYRINTKGIKWHHEGTTYVSYLCHHSIFFSSKLIVLKCVFQETDALNGYLSDDESFAMFYTSHSNLRVAVLTLGATYILFRRVCRSDILPKTNLSQITSDHVWGKYDITFYYAPCL